MDLDPALVLGGLGFLTGATSIIYARGQAVASKAQAEEAVRKRREDATLHVVETFQTAEFADLIVFLEFNLPQLATWADWEAMPREVQLSAARFVQRIEGVGIMVAERIIDIDLVEKALGSFVGLMWTRLGPALQDRREATKDAFTAEYFQWLAEKLAAREDVTRKPAYTALAKWTP